MTAWYAAFSLVIDIWSSVVTMSSCYSVKYLNSVDSGVPVMVVWMSNVSIHKLGHCLCARCQVWAPEFVNLSVFFSPIIPYWSVELFLGPLLFAKMENPQESPPLRSEVDTVDVSIEKEPITPTGSPVLRSSTPNTQSCPVCLGPIDNISFTDTCAHEFCFACLVQWSRVKPECPLCKRQFQVIMWVAILQALQPVYDVIFG